MNYVIAGYIVTFVVLGTYAASLIRRQRVLRRYLHADAAPVDVQPPRSGPAEDAVTSSIGGSRPADSDPDRVLGASDGDQ